MRMAEESYEYRAFFDRNFDPLVGIDSYTKKFLADQMSKKHGKGWEYAGIAPLSAIVTGDTQPQGFLLFIQEATGSSKPQRETGQEKEVTQGHPAIGERYAMRATMTVLD